MNLLTSLKSLLGDLGAQLRGKAAEIKSLQAEKKALETAPAPKAEVVAAIACWTRHQRKFFNRALGASTAWLQREARLDEAELCVRPLSLVTATEMGGGVVVQQTAVLGLFLTLCDELEARGVKGGPLFEAVVARAFEGVNYPTQVSPPAAERAKRLREIDAALEKAKAEFTELQDAAHQNGITLSVDDPFAKRGRHG
jgi:hypothetical protein